MTSMRTLQITTPNDREIMMTRVFDAPRTLVFDALTKPDLLVRWLGVFGGWSLAVCEIDFRVGGACLFIWRGPDGAQMGMRGVYREIVPPERIVQTEQFDDPWYEGEAIGTTVLAESDDMTTLTMTVRYASKEVRDAVLKTGMDQGMAKGYDALDSVLARQTIAGRYRAHADDFERKVVAVRPEQWSNRSPCAAWTARDVVRHIVEMHGYMLRPVDRTLSPAPSVDDDPLGAFRAARADVEAVLADARLAGTVGDTPSGRMSVEEQIDQVVADDLVLHGWDLARATGQDATMDPEDVRRLWATTSAIPSDLMEKYRTPGAFGPGVEVFGPEVRVSEDAPLQDRLLGLIGRDPG